jgi:hypothetical protein
MMFLVFALLAVGDSCSNCHEIAPTVAQWKASSHRNIDCEKCHGGTFQSANVNRLANHLRGKVPEQIRLKTDQVNDVVERCRGCHQSEFAAWAQGPHGSKYARIFTDAKHNSKHRLRDDCLRCHGMFFDGAIRDLVAPISTAGPWTIKNSKVAGDSAIPCLACHAVHTDGAPHNQSTRKEAHRPSLAFFDRRSGEHVLVDNLTIPAMRDGDRAVRMSPDRRQAICYQCHAPVATMQAGSGDDRTPLGVHEGLSCLSCHAKHGQDATASCSTCHPRLSNCGLDVEKMDTTFRDAKSRHNVHTVRCLDCHEMGIPKTGARLSPAAVRLTGSLPSSR